MAMMAGSAGGGRRRRRSRQAGVINEINMTPFIDVMLVLLIIFMVAAPMMTAGVPLDLPQTKAAPLNSDATPVTLSIKANGQVFLGETELTDEAIVGKLAEKSITIARRTVAKYREELGILPSNLRREYT